MLMYLGKEMEKTKRLNNGSKEGAQVAGFLEMRLPLGAFDIHFLHPAHSPDFSGLGPVGTRRGQPLVGS